MPADDIYSVVSQYELPSGVGSLKLYFEQVVNTTQVDNSNQLFAEAYDAHFGTAWRDLLSNDCWSTGTQVTKLTGNPEASYRFDNDPQVGLRTGPSLPNNNCIQVSIKQSRAGRKHDGRIYIPGIPEPDSNVGVLKVAYSDSFLGPFVTLLSTQIIETSGGAGRWNLGVIDQFILNIPVPPAKKDWEGAFAQSSGITGHVIIATQRRRQTKISHITV